jgi:hypothetical protein
MVPAPTLTPVVVTVCLAQLIRCANSFGPGRQVTQRFNFTGHSELYVWPWGAVELELQCYGAQGGNANNGYKRAAGGSASAWLTLAAVDEELVVAVTVGGEGGTFLHGDGSNGGYNGGGSASLMAGGSGGGGATDIRIGGTDLRHRVLVGGGGGGAPVSTPPLPPALPVPPRTVFPAPLLHPTTNLRRWHQQES